MSSSISLGSVIYAAVKPIIKIYLIIGSGFLLGRNNILTVETARNLSDMVLILIAPCLTFNKIVSSLSGSDIKAIGVIVLTQVVIYAAGVLCACLVKFTTPVPKKWIGGLFSGAIFANSGDLPIAYIQSMDSGLIFDVNEGNKGIAYIQIFGAMLTFFQFNLGGFRVVEYDFKHKLEDSEEVQEQKEVTSLDPLTGEEADTDDSKNTDSTVNSNGRIDGESNDDNENAIEDDDDDDDDEEQDDVASITSISSEEHSLKPTFIPIPFSRSPNQASSTSRRPSSSLPRRRLSVKSRRGSEATRTSTDTRPSRARRVLSNSSSYTSNSYASSYVTNMDLRQMPSQTLQDLIWEYSEVDRSQLDPVQQVNSATTYLTEIGGLSTHEIKKSGGSIPFIEKYHLNFLVFVAKNFKRPMSISLFISLFCAMMPWIRALFVTNSIDIPSAPDQLPPLSFIMDYTSYIGAAQVPMGLLLLGATLSRLKIDKFPPGFWKTSLLLTACKLCIMPIIGVLWTTLIKHENWITDNVGFLILVLNWGLPSGTTQIYLTASYTDPEDLEHLQMDCLAIFLLNQYALLGVSLPFLVTYTLKVFLNY